MKLKKQTIEELKQIMAKDYGASLGNEELTNLGVSLLRLTRIATNALIKEREGIYVRTNKLETKK